MPFLRYFTGDIVRRTPTGYQLLGRERDLFFNTAGRVVSTFEIDAAMPVNLFRRKFIRPASSGKFSLLKPLAR